MDTGDIRGFVWRRAEGLAAPAIHGKVGLRDLDNGRDRDGRRFCPEENASPRCAGSRGPSPASTAPATALPGARSAPRRIVFRRARQYVLDRKQFGRPLAANQLIQKKLADMLTEIALGLQGCLRLGPLKDEGAARWN